MPQPAVTVLMPCRDAAATVAQAVQSIFSQKSVALRLLAIDDGSRDETGEVLTRLARIDPRLIIITQKRLGLVAALNRGLAEADTSWIARQDADDISHPARLETQFQMATKNPDLDVIGCRIRGFPMKWMTDGMRRYQQWQNGLGTHEQMESELFVESPLAHASALIRTESLRTVGGYREFDGPEDWDLWARMLAAGCRFGKARRTLYFWREHEKRATRIDPRMAPGKFRTVKLKYLLSGPLAGRQSVELWSYGEQGQAWQEELKPVIPDLVYRSMNPRAAMSGRSDLPPFPPRDGRIVLVAFGTPKIRLWFKNELTRRGAVGDRGDKVFLLIG